MTAEAAAWPWRVALETLGHDAAAAPPHTLAKLIEGEKLPWVVARVEKALRREDAAADEEEIVSTKEPEKAHIGVGGDHSQLQQEEEMMI